MSRAYFLARVARLARNPPQFSDPPRQRLALRDQPFCRGLRPRGQAAAGFGDAATHGLGQAAVVGLTRWLHKKFAQNRPFDEMAREIVTAQGPEKLSPFPDGVVEL